MIADVLSLSRWEWFKLRRRRMPWVLLTLTVLLLQFAFWVSYALLRGGLTLFVEGRDPGSITVLTDVRFIEMFAFPNSLTNGLAGAHLVGRIMVMVLAASVIGSKCSLGAVGAVPTRGTRRWPLLASKLLLLAALSVAILFVATAALAISSVIALATLDANWISVSADGSDLGIRFGKAIYGMLPFVALAAFAAVMTSSSRAAIGISLGYYVAESILAVVLGPFEWFERVAAFTLGRAVSGWMQNWTNVALYPYAGLPDATQSFLVILAHVIVLLGAAFWLFQRRDIAGAKGE